MVRILGSDLALAKSVEEALTQRKREKARSLLRMSRNL